MRLRWCSVFNHQCLWNGRRTACETKARRLFVGALSRIRTSDKVLWIWWHSTQAEPHTAGTTHLKTPEVRKGSTRTVQCSSDGVALWRRKTRSYLHQIKTGRQTQIVVPNTLGHDNKRVSFPHSFLPCSHNMLQTLGSSHSTQSVYHEPPQ